MDIKTQEDVKTLEEISANAATQIRHNQLIQSMANQKIHELLYSKGICRVTINRQVSETQFEGTSVTGGSVVITLEIPKTKYVLKKLVVGQTYDLESKTMSTVDSVVRITPKNDLKAPENTPAKRARVEDLKEETNV